ncbi:MAG TPA: response regulator transcription factor [Pseudonocardiaceae bacterium]|jgi:DNA-binding response OmpR family regulator|nr:response regulator transcription factor [Pseudonocardiaceae bacterium]
MSVAGSVLLVDDDALVRDVLGRCLGQAGYQVTATWDSVDALLTARDTPPDLVILDLIMPGLSGLEVCQLLRIEGPVPIVLLTIPGEEEDRIVCLDLGVDDYIAKPVSPDELVLRVGSVLRWVRSSQPATQLPPITDDGLLVDVAARRAVLDGQELVLTVREFDLLAFLLQHPGRAFTSSELLEQVWGWTFGDTSTVTVHVRRLREKVETDPAAPRRIVTVWADDIGYRYDSTE